MNILIVVAKKLAYTVKWKGDGDKKAVLRQFPWYLVWFGFVAHQLL